MSVTRELEALRKRAAVAERLLRAVLEADGRPTSRRRSEVRREAIGYLRSVGVDVRGPDQPPLSADEVRAIERGIDPRGAE